MFIGSHLEKWLNNMQRLYHNNTMKTIELKVGEVIVFDRNLCHCGGDSTVTKSFGKKSYISDCVKSSIGKVNEKELFFDDVKRYSK
jgi:hypothetical protein